MHTVDGNLMFGNQVALDRFGQPLRSLDTNGSGARSVRFNFEDVALMTGQAGRQSVQLALRVLGEDAQLPWNGMSRSLIW